MTREEFALYTLELEATFRGDLAEDREAAILSHVGRVPLEQARGAIRELVMAGQTWMPTPGEIVKALRRVEPDAWRFRCMIEGKTDRELRDELTARFRKALPSVTDER